MCGLSGVLFNSEQKRDQFQAGLEGFRRNARRISHRGDTDQRELILNTLWLYHYRLAFQDVSAGVQPMFSSDEQHVIVFNGEVYNHLSLRKNISQHSCYEFKTRSDTETILQGWKVFGEDFFSQLEGEYAFVINKIDGSYLLAHRDHFGVKPLFFLLDGINSRQFENYQSAYSFVCDRLEFSSEVKALPSSINWNRNGLLRQFVGLYEAICTPFENIIHLPAGGLLIARKQNGRFSCKLSTNTNAIRLNSYAATSKQASEQEFEAVLQQSVKDRLLSDVELGIYLSGGVDSKAIAYELARCTTQSQKIKSFTVGFSDQAYDETAEALRFSKHLGFDPHVMTINNAALNYSYPLAIQNSELIQPYTNGAAKWWLSLFARQYVKGVLTGDGADELLCGYPSYRYASWWKHCMRIRGQATDAQQIDALLKQSPLGSFKRDSLYVTKYSADTKNPWLAGSSAAGNGDDFIDSIRLLGVAHPLFGQIQTISTILLGQSQAINWLQSQAASIQSWFVAGLENNHISLCDPQHSLLLWQNYFAKTHLPTLILNWVGDRMEMANTLEGRTPFLSRALRKLIMQQADKTMISGLNDKVLLRRSYAKLLTSEFAKTPKKQFNAPFINSVELMKTYRSHTVFETTGIADNSMFENLLEEIHQPDQSPSHYSTHLRSTLQSAISMSIVHHSIVEQKQISRDSKLENHYLEKAGPQEMPR